MKNHDPVGQLCHAIARLRYAIMFGAPPNADDCLFNRAPMPGEFSTIYWETNKQLEKIQCTSMVETDLTYLASDQTETEQ